MGDDIKIQIKNSFDKLTLKKIGLEGLKIGAIAAVIFILQALLGLDFGQYNMIVIPVIRWLIGNVEQFAKGE